MSERYGFGYVDHRPLYGSIKLPSELPKPWWRMVAEDMPSMALIGALIGCGFMILVRHL